MRLASPPDAQAAVVYSGIQNIAIPADFDGVFLNVVTQQHDTTEFSGWDLNPFFGGLGIANSPDFQPARLGTNNEDAIVPLSFGSSSSGSLTFAAGVGGSGAEDFSGHLGPGATQFTAGQAAYFGFQLTRNNTVNYGWMQVTLTRAGSTGVIQDWAYDTSGSALLVGATGNVGAAPRIVQAGEPQAASAITAGTAVLVSKDSEFTFQETTTQGNFSGIISGGGDVKVAGAGGIRWTGTNTFTGTAAVLAGSSLTVTHKDNLGAAAIELNPAAALVFDSLAANNGTANTYSNPITITADTGTLRNTGSGTVVLTGTLTKNGSVLAFASGTFAVSGTILGSSPNSDLLVDGASVTLLTANSYNGPTYIRNAGTLIANVTGALPSATRSDLIMDDSGSGSSHLTLGASQQIASLTGSSTSTVALGATTLTIGATAGSSSFAGGIAGSGGSLVKDGASTLVLSGANSYSGSTLVSAGTLVVNGALASVAVSVSGGLSGTGSLAGNTTIQNGGTHAPGALGGVGSQAFGANLSYANHSIFEWDLNTNSNSNTGGGFDTVSAVGNISVGTTGSIFKVVFGSNVDITNGTNSFWNTPNTTRIWSLASIFGQAVAAGSFQSVETNYPVTSYGAFSIDSSNLTWTPGPQCPNPAAPSPACCWLPACCAGNAVSGRYSASPEWLPLMVVVSAMILV
jgi:autotransporter-associated beta strand protein